MDTFARIISLWPTAEALAQDIGQRGGTVRQWRNRDAIPSKFWADIIEAAERREIPDVTMDRLGMIARISASGSEAA